MNKKYNSFFCIMIFLATITSLTTLLAPILVNVWSDNLEILNREKIFIILAVLILSLIIKTVTILIREHFAKNFNIGNFKMMINKYFKLDYDIIVEKGPTNLIERMIMATNSIYIYMTGDNINIWASSLIITISLFLVGIKNLNIFLIMLLAIPINYLGFKSINKILEEKSKNMQIATSTGWQKIMSITKHTDYLKQFDDHNLIIDNMEPTLNHIYKSMADINIFAQSSSNFIFSLNEIFKIAIMILTIVSFSKNISSYGDLILITLVVPIYFQNISTITNSNLNKRDLNIAVDLLNEWDKNKEANGNISISGIESIEFKIDKLHLKDKVIAKNIYGSFKKGDIVWVKGPSGSGKSTLMKLLLKYRQENSIYINHIDIKSIENSCLKNNLSYLSQDVPIINGNLRENFFFNKSYSSDLEDKLKNEPFLSSIFKNKDMDSIIGDHGANLSGGERQKISVARILYDQKDLLILDEITSNIDDKSAREIYTRLLKNSKDKITFIISHDNMPKDFTNKELLISK